MSIHLQSLTTNMDLKEEWVRTKIGLNSIEPLGKLETISGRKGDRTDGTCQHTQDYPIYVMQNEVKTS